MSARIEFSPDASVLITVDYNKTDQKGPALALVAEDYSSRGAPPNTQPLEQNLFTANPFLYPPAAGTSNDHQISSNYGAMAELDYNLHFATLTGQFGFRREIADSQAQGPGDNPMAATGVLKTPSDAKNYSGELRLASPAKARLQWVAGLFYFTELTAGDTCITATAASATCFIEYGNPFQRTKSYAAFGQATYTPPVGGDRLHLTFGGRYNEDKKDADTFEILPFQPPLPNNGLKATFHAVTYKAEASYDVTPRNLVYLENSTGFRAGGFEYGITPEYKPENIISYELGSKNRFFDNTLQLNLAAWYYVYKNQATQVSYVPPGGFIPIQTVQSVGKVHYSGISGSLEYAVTATDRITLNVIYADNHFARYQVPAIFQNAPPLDLLGRNTGQTPGYATGLEVPGTAPWAGNFAYDHLIHAFQGVFDGRAAIQFSDRTDSSPEYPNTLQYKAGLSPAYARVDLSISYTPVKGSWRVTGYVNNITDEATLVSRIYEGISPGTGDVTANLMPPRTVGAFVSYRF